MSIKRNVPPVRFPEFQGEWTKKRFGDFATLFSEKYDPTKSTDNYRCIELENIVPGCGTVSGHFESSTQKSIKNRFSRGDILFGKLRPYLKKYWKAEFEGVCSSEIWVLRAESSSSNEFIYRIVQTERFNQLCSKSSGTKMPRADWDYVQEATFLLPSHPEQQKIASFFSLIDKRIKKQQEKITHLEDLKKGLIQKIFSRELRFKDENGEEYPEWEEMRLGDFLTYEQPTQYLVTDTDYECFPSDTNVPVLTANKGFILGYTREKEGIYNKGEVVIFDDFTMDFKFVDFPFKVKSSAIKLLSAASDDNNLRFIYYWLSTLNLTPGGHQRHYISLVQGFTVRVPSLSEEQKIVQVLSRLDKCIDKSITLLEEWKLLKKGLLQQMFA